MVPNPKISVTSESFRHLSEGIGEAGDVLRHEGLKRIIETGLFWAGSQEMGRLLLRVSAEGFSYVTDPRLATSIGGIALEGPTGIAAGWDKTGKSILGWQALGANHITVGGVPLYPQAGNRMPRLRTFDKTVGDHGKSVSLNSFGFYSPGSKKVAYNIGKQKETGEVSIPVIVQVTVNKEFYEPANKQAIPNVLVEAVRQVKPVADGIEVGINSPNTAGMRGYDSEFEEFLYANYMAAHEAAGDLPFSFKADADGGEQGLDMYSRLGLRTGADFISLINTTAKKEIKGKYGAEDLPGGLAGADPEYQQMAIDAVRYVFEAIGDKVDIMGMGGNNSDQQQIGLITAGARATGVNSAVRQHGHRAVSQRDIDASNFMRRMNLRSLDRLAGLATKRGPLAA